MGQSKDNKRPGPCNRPAYLRLSITDRCNLRCKYCAPGGAAAQLVSSPLADEELLNIVARIHAARPVGKVRLTGGEPLLHPDVVGLVRRLGETIPGAEMAITTNGTLLKRLAAPLRAAGITRVNISMDSLDPARFQAVTGAALGPVLKGVDAARAAGFSRLKLNAVLQRTVNGGELPELVRFASSQGAEIRFIELMPVGCAAHLYEDEHLSAAQALGLLQRAFPYRGPLDSPGTAQRHQLEVDGQKVPVGFIAPVSHPFCSSCNRLRLDAQGHLSPCLRSTEQHNLAGAGGLRVAQILAGIGRESRSQATVWPDREMVSIGG